LNPFNQNPLTDDELQQDCLFYISYEGKPVKASRLFAGYEHEEQIKKLASHYNMDADHYRKVEYNAEIITRIRQNRHTVPGEAAGTAMLKKSRFGFRDLSAIPTYEEAYHQLIADLIMQQITSTKLVLKDTPVKKIFVDGGFSKNAIYMRLLADAFADMEVYASSVSLATAMGAALAIHNHWNTRPLPKDVIDLKFYAASHDDQL
jgi:sugar (pentulose or hexulose) kinase